MSRPSVGDRAWVHPHPDCKEIKSKLPAVVISVLTKSERCRIRYTEHRCKMEKIVSDSRLTPREEPCQDLGER